MRNGKSAFVCNGSTGHSKSEREQHDYYATDPKAIELLLDLEQFDKNIWECACGQGHLSEPLKENGYKVLCSDLIDRGYENTKVLDFLAYDGKWKGDIITNPPYKKAKEFVEKALSIIPIGNKVIMFLKLTFLESLSRRKLFNDNPPKIIYVSSGRLLCAKNGDFKNYESSAIAYAWYI